MNLRGTILPVIDLRIRFHLPAVEYNNFTVIVIAAIGGKTVGLLVDAVCDVLMIAQDAMRQAPDFGAAVDTRFMNGVFESRKHLTVALDLEELLSDCAVALPQSIAA
jgi:purine-binding chemotaxis protein CheW